MVYLKSKYSSHHSCIAWMSTCAVLALPEPRRQLLPSGPAPATRMTRNSNGHHCSQNDLVYNLVTNWKYAPNAKQLLEGHGVQLHNCRPHQPLPLAQMWPRQRLVGQVPQTLHEGPVALIAAWAWARRK